VPETATITMSSTTSGELAIPQSGIFRPVSAAAFRDHVLRDREARQHALGVGGRIADEQPDVVPRFGESSGRDLFQRIGEFL